MNQSTRSCVAPQLQERLDGLRAIIQDAGILVDRYQKDALALQAARDKIENGRRSHLFDEQHELNILKAQETYCRQDSQTQSDLAARLSLHLPEVYRGLRFIGPSRSWHDDRFFDWTGANDELRFVEGQARTALSKAASEIVTPDDATSNCKRVAKLRDGLCELWITGARLNVCFDEVERKLQLFGWPKSCDLAELNRPADGAEHSPGDRATYSKWLSDLRYLRSQLNDWHVSLDAAAAALDAVPKTILDDERLPLIDRRSVAIRRLLLDVGSWLRNTKPTTGSWCLRDVDPLGVVAMIHGGDRPPATLWRDQLLQLARIGDDLQPLLASLKSEPEPTTSEAELKSLLADLELLRQENLGIVHIATFWPLGTTDETRANQLPKRLDRGLIYASPTRHPQGTIGSAIVCDEDAAGWKVVRRLEGLAERALRFMPNDDLPELLHGLAVKPLDRWLLAAHVALRLPFDQDFRKSTPEVWAAHERRQRGECDPFFDLGQHDGTFPKCACYSELNVDNAMIEFARNFQSGVSQSTRALPPHSPPKVTASMDRPQVLFGSDVDPNDPQQRLKTLRSLTVTQRNAYWLWQFAKSELGDSVEDRPAHDWLRRQKSLDIDEAFCKKWPEYCGELKGGSVQPTFDAWYRALNIARRKLGENKNQKRQRGSAVGSVEEYENSDFRKRFVRRGDEE